MLNIVFTFYMEAHEDSFRRASVGTSFGGGGCLGGFLLKKIYIIFRLFRYLPIERRWDGKHLRAVGLSGRLRGFWGPGWPAGLYVVDFFE